MHLVKILYEQGSPQTIQEYPTRKNASFRSTLVVSSYSIASNKVSEMPLEPAPLEPAGPVRESARAALSRHFGWWEEVPESPGRLKTSLKFLERGMCEISFSLKAESSTIENFSVKPLENGAIPGEIPAFTVPVISGRTAEMLIKRLLLPFPSSRLSWNSHLEETLGFVAREAKLSDLSFAKDILEFKLRSGLQVKVFSELNQTHEVSEETIETIRADMTRQPEAYFKTRGPIPVLTDFLGTKRLYESSLLGTLAEALANLNTPRSRDLLLDMFLRGKSHYGVDFIACLRDVNAAVGKSLIDAVLEFAATTRENHIFSLLRHFNAFREESRKEIVSYFAEKLVAGKLSAELFFKMLDSPLAMVSWRSAMRGLPGSLTEGLLQDDNIRRTIVTNLDLFRKEDVPHIIRGLMEFGSAREIVPHLNRLAGLPSELAFSLISERKVKEVLANLKSFDLTRAQLRELVSKVIERSGIPRIVSHLQVLPDYILADQERDWHLESYAKDLGIPSFELYQDYLALKQKGDQASLSALLLEIFEMKKTILSSQPILDSTSRHPHYDTLVRHFYPSHAVAHELAVNENGIVEFPDDGIGLLDGLEDLELEDELIDAQFFENEILPAAPGVINPLDAELDLLLENLEQQEQEQIANLEGEFNDVANALDEPELELPGPSDTIDRTAVRGLAALDRTPHILRFKLRDAYKMPLSQGVKMVLHQNALQDEAALRKIGKEIEFVKGQFFAPDKEEPFNRFDKLLNESVPTQNEAFLTREEKILGAFLEAIAGKLNSQTVKRLVIAYEFACQGAALARYVEGTQDRVRKAPTPEYFDLLELREFLSDTLPDTVQRVLKRCKRTEALTLLLAEYYREAQQHTLREEISATVNRSRLEKMGITPELLKALSDLLLGPQESHKKVAAVANIIEREQEKIANLTQSLTGQKLDVSEIHLATFDPKLLISAAEKKDTPTPSKDILVTHLAKKFMELFAAEVGVLDREIKKFKPEVADEKRARVLEGVITKNAASVHARAVSGVCVADDNPRGYRDYPSQWDLPNFLQMVLRDPDTSRCEGLILLHYYEVSGKRILAASFNPTSTYLFKVDERDLFKGLLRSLSQFCQDNEIDMIVSSKSHTIRTNRTGGEFERALKDTIKRVNKEFSLPKPAPFSYSPRYNQQDFDVLWERAQKSE